MDFLKKHILLILIAFGMLAALIFYLLNIPDNRSANMVERGLLTIFAPVMKPVHHTSAMARSAWDDYINLVVVRRENQLLKEQIKGLNSRVVEGDEAIQANTRLMRLLEMKKGLKAPTVTASVIGEDTASWFSTIVIDRGSSSGLREGLAVVASDGLVGQVIKVTSDTARVLLLTDHSSGVAATIQRSRARGVVKGKGDGQCSLEFTNREEDVKVGDVVVASGIGGIFKKGLPIGEVTMVKKGEYGIFQTILIRPGVNLAHLEEVLVIMRGGHE